MSANIGARNSRFFLVLLLWSGLGATPAMADDDAAVGKRQAAKANHLVEKHDCAGAVIAFAKAYWFLHDPTLLFNRAECLRKMGKNSEAIKDYEQFLAELPATPNRASVEARIATLRVPAPSEDKPATGSEPKKATPDKPKVDKPKEEKPAPAEPRAEKWTD